MIVSWNELQRTCQKALRGLGVPAGADDDAAFAVLWLQARGFDALTPLDAALSALERTPPRPLRLERRDDGVDVLDAAGQPAVSVASDALDLALARAFEQGACSDALLTRVEGGIVVAGTLPQRPIPGDRRAEVHWRERGVRCRLDIAADGECRVCTTTGQGAEHGLGLGRDAVRIVLGEPRRGQGAERGLSWSIDADHGTLEHRAMDSVTRGIEVPGALWTRLLEFAKRTLVPASNASRERGAGGGEYND